MESYGRLPLKVRQWATAEAKTEESVILVLARKCRVCELQARPGPT